MTPISPRSPRARTAATLLVLAGLIAAASGCTNPADMPTAGVIEGASAVTCDDVDSDGFGPGCVQGEDCDDEDDAVTSECYRCAEPGPGCPCDVDGSSLFCAHVVGKVGDQGTCGPGYAVCQGGVWGECVLNYTATASGATAN